MSVELRIMLIVGAVLTMVYFLGKIRSNRLQIGYAVFWSVFSLAMILLAIFPGIVEVAAGFVGVSSPVNLLYLAILFCVIMKLFDVTVKLSKVNSQLTELTQKIAIKESEKQEKEGTKQ